VKSAVLRAYELVPEEYRQKFRSSRKNESDLCRNKETFFDCWCVSKDIQKNFSKLRQLVLMEEFKNFLPSDIKTYLNEQKIDRMHRAATCADDYALTHKPFGKPPLCMDPSNGSVTNSNGDNP